MCYKRFNLGKNDDKFGNQNKRKRTLSARKNS